MSDIKASDFITRKQCEHAEKMADEIKEVILNYAGLIPMALAIGVIEVVKTEMIRDHE